MTKPAKAPTGIDPDKLAEVQAEVDAAIQERSDDWRLLQNRILARAGEYQKMEALRGAIYRIYSRESRQTANVAHPHLKAASKIAEEIALHRFGGAKQRGAQTKSISPVNGFMIFDVSDVIGITIVCPFDSDVQRVAEQIKADCDGKLFVAVSEIKQHDRRDYQAVHISLSINEGALQVLQCEVQIKTAVQDAFSWKTHALAYKPSDDADPWFVEQFVRISVLLRTADSLSDQLRDRLEEERNVSVKKRKLVHECLQLVVRQYVTRIGNEDKREELQKILELLGNHGAAGGSPSLQSIKNEIQAAFKKFGYDVNIFRMAVLCAMSAAGEGELFWLDGHFHRWLAEVASADKSTLGDRTRCANLIAMAHYCSNDLRGAIRIAETALRHAAKEKSLEVGQLHVNLAYYYAEQISGSSDVNIEKAKKHAEQARQMISDDKLDASDLDSLGFVKISTGGTIAEIEEGLAECKKAFDESNKDDADPGERDLAKTFFEVHQELAYKRLHRMVSNQES